VSIIRHTRIKTRTYTDNTSRSIPLTTMIVEYNDKVQILIPLYEYQLKKHMMSKSWHNKLLQAVNLLLDYMEVNQDCYSSPEEFFASFAEALYCGTINEDGYDKSGLYWIPKKTDTANRLLNQLSEFSDWLCNNYGSIQLNPWRDANSYEQKLNWIAQINKSQRSFLGHLDSTLNMSETARKVRNLIMRRNPVSARGGTKAFPEDQINMLLWEGFNKTNKKNNLSLLDSYNWRDIAITILMHGGGLRHSEVLHLWVQDVMDDPYDPNLALVRIYHPSEGAPPKDFIDPLNGKPLNNREAYLRLKYGLQSRNQYISNNSRFAGWKDPKLDNEREYYMHVYWFPQEWGYIFRKVWKMYLLKRMHERIEEKHPFAFVSFYHKNKGEMLSMSASRESHAKAVEKIGLTVSKTSGTTEHGHRHAYGQRLSVSGIDRRIIQAAMHHKSAESQNVYTEPTIINVTNSLNKATQALENGTKLPMEDDIDAFFNQEKKIKKRFI